MKFFEIGAEVLVPKFTRAEVRLPVSKLDSMVWNKTHLDSSYISGNIDS